ncbi:MAG: hypothetical protein WAV90_13965 [Gordonia amarae]
MASRTGYARGSSAQVSLERRVALTQWGPAVVAVLPLDAVTSTSPVSAALSIVLQSLSPVSVVAVDADGDNQPLRYMLNSTGAGDLIGLASAHGALRRRAVEDFVDVQARVPLASCWLDGPGAIPPGIMRDAIWKLQRRYPALVVDVPHGVPAPTMAAVCELATHVVLVGDGADARHDWLHAGGSVVSRLAATGAVTVVGVGGSDTIRSVCRECAVVPIGVPHAGIMSEGPADADSNLTYGLAEVIVRIGEARMAGEAPA